MYHAASSVCSVRVCRNAECIAIWQEECRALVLCALVRSGVRVVELDLRVVELGPHGASSRPRN